MADIIAKTKSGPSTSRENYLVELALERITGQRAGGFTSAAIQWGMATEPMARAAYEAACGVLVDEVGFVPHPRIEMAGASPDGMVGDDGLLEIKCPNSSTHLGTLRTKKPSGGYLTQMHWQMACTNRAWCDFVSFDPRFPYHLQLFTTRVHRNDAVIADLESEVERFLADVDLLVAELSGIGEIIEEPNSQKRQDLPPELVPAE